jgi:ribosomal protein S18 acetylase RimI-like enzyme
MNGTVTLRPITDADMDFLHRLYATTREDELKQVDWSPEQKAAFVAQQFHAQHQFWRENYQDTSWDLIVDEGRPIGRLYVARWAEEIRIVDIALMPEHRGSGVGTRLIRRLFDEGDASGRKVSIHVEIFNPARRLYDRMGFVQAAERGVYLLMERAPAAAAVEG